MSDTSGGEALPWSASSDIIVRALTFVVVGPYCSCFGSAPVRSQCSCSCCGAFSAVVVQRGEANVVPMVAKSSSPETDNLKAEPQSIVGRVAAVVTVRFVFALLPVCVSNIVCWEAAFARQAGSNGC